LEEESSNEGERTHKAKNHLAVPIDPLVMHMDHNKI